MTASMVAQVIAFPYSAMRKLQGGNGADPLQRRRKHFPFFKSFGQHEECKASDYEGVLCYSTTAALSKRFLAGILHAPKGSRT